MAFDLKNYKLLSFDIYGTLIDWESGIYEGLLPLLKELPTSNPHRSDSASESRRYILSEYARLEAAVQAEQPALKYSQLLAAVHIRLCDELSIPSSPSAASAFGATIGTWPAFPDTVAAMQVLATHYKLVALSNVDRASFSNTYTGPLAGVTFDAIYTAEDIGSYKPDPRNFEYLVSHVKEDFGVEKVEILHVAQSLFHDHVPGKKADLQPGVWIARNKEQSAIGGDFDKLKEKGEVNVAKVFATLGEFAGEVKKAFGDE